MLSSLAFHRTGFRLLALVRKIDPALLPVSLIYALKMAGFSDVIIIDKDALAGSSGLKKLVRKVFLKLYKLQYRFWNKITASATHSPSPDVFSYEIKALAST